MIKKNFLKVCWCTQETKQNNGIRIIKHIYLFYDFMYLIQIKISMFKKDLEEF